MPEIQIKSGIQPIDLILKRRHHLASIISAKLMNFLLFLPFLLPAETNFPMTQNEKKVPILYNF